MKKAVVSLWILFFSVVINAQSPNFVWAKTFGGAAGDNCAASTIDASGNLYLTGNFSGTADFDPGPGVFNLTAAGAYDIFVYKLDQSGNLVWAKAMGGGNLCTGFDIALDASGNIYTTGEFSGPVDFDPGPGVYSLASSGSSDIYISKLDPLGNFVWTKSIGGTLGDEGKSITLDGLGNVYTTGYYYTNADFDPGPGTFYLPSASGSGEAFISKLDASGNFIWAKNMGGEEAYSISVDASWNVYIAGRFNGTCDFDPGIGVYNLTGVNDDIFITKLNSSGNFMWTRAMGGAGADVALSTAVDVSGNLYTTGFFYGTSDFDPGIATYNLSSVGNEDVFISKLDPLGNFVWAKSMGGAIDDDGTFITVDASGCVYTAGQYYATSDFDPGPGIFNMTASGFYDVFISKLDPSGNFLWAESFGGPGSDLGNSIALEPSGDIYVSGNFSDTADFDPGVGVYNLTTGYYPNAFVVKLTPKPLGMSDNSFDNTLIYPNPSNGQVTVKLKVPGQVTITDAMGRFISSNYFYSESVDFDLSKEGKGIYFLKVISEKENFYKKIIVQ